MVCEARRNGELRNWQILDKFKQTLSTEKKIIMIFNLQNLKKELKYWKTISCKMQGIKTVIHK